MENASKALLIAGSILIVILLIAVGVRILNSTSGTTDSVESTMQTTETAMFNQKFLKHIKKSASSSQVISFLNEAISNNAAYGFAEPQGTRNPTVNTRTIWVNYRDASGLKHDHAYTASGIKNIMNEISSSSRYDIYISECSLTNGSTGYHNGYIICMCVKLLP